MELCSNMDESECHQDEIKTNEVNVFEPELLKTRLLELQREIDIFRKESAALLLQRRRLQEDQTALHKEYVTKEKRFEETRRRVQNQLEEEKKRVTREKIAMENRIRDAQEKAKQNKLERQKAQSLQEQLEKMRDELNVKESRWNAAESRYKSELRVLRVEISKLKQEISNLQNTKRTNVKNIKKSASGQTITRAISQINKRITATPSKETLAKMHRDLSSTSSDASVRDDNNDDNDGDNGERNKLIEPITKIIEVNSDFDQMENDVPVNKIETRQKSEPKSNLKMVKPAEQAKKKQDLYAALLKDAISDLVENKSQSYIKKDADDLRQPMVTQRLSPKHNRTSENSNEKSCSFANEDSPGHTAHTAEYFAEKSRKVHQDNNKNETTTQDQISSSKEKNSSPESHRSSIDPQIGRMSAKDAVKEIRYFDGRIEYWYPNGNVKKIFPDQGVSKMIYYNGDVRETDKDGKVKYFYATSRTWHTTTPDGVEILEFPSGQVEKRTSDGTVEASFPDGSVRIAHADGTEKWSLPDGTIAETFSNGDKILTLPNGQREIHTKSHKRREYPDGTVKLIYADGTQETRYSSGRKRLKDKDGNLLMDSYD